MCTCSIFIISSIFAISAAQADYIRFWTGFAKREIKKEKFIEGLNKKFFKETIEQSRIASTKNDFGITAYLPVILTDQDANYPDEYALVIYKDEKTYEDLRRTERGAKYFELHWEYFDRDKSKSTVPESYPAKIEKNRAYNVIAYSGWKAASTLFRITKKSLSTNHIAEIIENTKHATGILGYIVLVTENYLLEYVAFDKKKVSIIQRPDYDTQTIYLSSRKLSDNSEDISSGQGINWNW